MLLEEFDRDSDAIINPDNITNHLTIADDAMPDTAICVFAGAIIDQLRSQGMLESVGYISSINRHQPVYRYQLANGQKVLVALAAVGAAACIGDFEELGAHGVHNFIVLGTCGVLTSKHRADQIIIPKSALRDEGTIYHYAPPADIITARNADLALMQATFEAEALKYTVATTWTTDGFFRETRTKTARRLAQGAEVVDMEASALMAWSQWRNFNLYQFFYTADELTDAGWKHRKEERVRDVNDFFHLAELVAERVAGR